MEENFTIDLTAQLDQTKSQKQIEKDIKSMGDIKIPLVGTLSKKTEAQLKKDIASLNETVNLTGKVDSKSTTSSAQQAAQQAQKTVNSKPIELSFAVKKEKLINDIKLLAQQNSRLFKDTDMSIKYNTLLDNAEMAKNTVELSTLRTQLGSLRSELKITGNAGLTMTDALKNGLTKILQLFGGHGIIMQFTAQLRNAWKEAKELDASVTSLSKVCDELADRNSFPAYIDKSISKAKELCTDVNDLLYAVTEFKKLGNSLENSEILAEYAIRLQNVGDTDIDTAISSIKTAMASFDEIGGFTDNEYESKVEAYIDLINNLSNKFSIDAESLANAVRISAGTLTEANTSIEEATAVITAANKYYDDPAYLANTLKIGALRLRASKTSDEAKELAELGESIDDLAESTSSLREEMMALTGVDIMVDDKNFKSYYQQLLDISEVYQSLDETTQANVLEKMFGKNRSAAGANILKAMADSVEVYNEALQSAGSSEEEFSRWTESAEAATKRFSTAMTETYSNLLSGDTVKGLANAATAVLDFANKLGLVEKGFKGILMAGTLKGITTLTVAFKNSAVQLSNYGSALDAVKKVSTCAQDTRDYAEAMKTLKASCANLTDAQLKQVLANKNLSDSQLKEILQLKDLKKEEVEARLTQLGLTQATNAQTEANGKATSSAFKFSSAVKGLGANFKSFLASNKITIAIMAITTAISLVNSQISKHNQKLEEARQKAAELAEAYKQQQSSLDSQIEKYKELKESLDKGNLSTDEARSIKEQLLEIQKSLIESYGNEASNIDLVNGKYREQLGLLSELSKEKANDFIIEHRDIYNEAKRALEAVKTYDLGTVTSWSNIAPQTEDQKRLIEFIKSYSDLLELSYQGHSASYGGNDYVAAVNLSVKANVADADEIMHQFAADLEQYINENNIDVDVSGLLENGIPEQIRNTWTDELKEYKEIYDEFMKAEIVRNDTLRPLYQQSIQAVEDYNKALSSGEGIEEAKANLDSVQQSVQNATGTLEGSQDIFDDIYEGINKNAEAAYNLNQAFINDESVKGYAEQLRGLSDIDLQAINFDNENTEKGEEAFKGLMEVLELTEDQTQKLIDKLVELGYVQGEVQKQIAVVPDVEVSLTITQTIDQLNTQLKPAFDSLKSAYNDIFTSDGFALDSIDILSTCDSIKSKLDDMAETGLSIDYSSYEDFVRVLRDSESTEQDVEVAFDSLATSITQAALSGTEDFETMKAALEDLGVVNNKIVAFGALISNTEALKEAGLDLADATDEQIVAFANETISAENVSQAIAMLTYQKELCNLQEMNTAAEVANLRTLAENAGYTGEVIKYLTELEQIYQEVASHTMDPIVTGAKLGRAAMLQAMIQGTASKIDYGIDVDYKPSKKSSSGSGSSSPSSSSSSSEKSEFSDTIDFFERRVEKLNDAINLLKTNLDNVSGSFAKNNLIDAELGVIGEKFNNYTDALSMYTEKADEALSKLPSDIAAKVKDGAVSLTDFIGDGNKDVVEAIKEYESWADKVADCKQELAELRKEIRQLELEKFNNIMDDFQNQFDLRDDSKDLISKQIGLLKEAGELIGESFYKTQIDQSKKQLELLENEKAQLVNQMSDAINSGRIRSGTEEWLSMINSLSDVDGSILDCKKSIEEFDNEILSLHTEIFERIQDQFSNLDSEISNIIDLFDEFDVSDDKGIWSKEAIAQLGLLTQQYELAQYQVQQYNNEIDELNKQYLAGRYSATEYADRLASLTEKQWSAVKVTESAKDSIMDLNEVRVENASKGIEKEIDAFDELTQAQIKALKASKDLHDYENSIAEKTKSIIALERQISAMQNDTSAATVAKRKKLEEQLAEAKKDLEEAEYQHSIEAQEDALNKQFEDYEATRNKEIEALRESLNDRETILSTSFNTVKENASLVGQEIATMATAHGVTVSNTLISSWQSGEKAVASYGEVLSQNTSTFIGNIMGVENEVWNLQAQANDAADSLAWMFSTKADNLVNELAASYYAEGNLVTMTNALQDSLVNTLEGGYDISSIISSLNDIANGANNVAGAARDAARALSEMGAQQTANASLGKALNRGDNGKNYSASDMVYHVGSVGSSVGNGVYQKVNRYASGTRGTKGNLIITDEEGYELKLPKLANGQYTLLNEGSQVFTKEQTDKLYELANTDNRNLIPITEENLRMVFDVGYKGRVQEPVIDKRMSPPVNIHYDSMFEFNGDVIDADRAIKQMEKVAKKISHNEIVDFGRDFCDGIKYGSSMRKWNHKY